MGANKTKLNKAVLRQLVQHTNREPAEINAMYKIFCQHFPSGRIESPQDLHQCLQKFSLAPVGHADPKAIERLYRVFEGQIPNARNDRTIDFFHFMIVSHFLERGTVNQKISLYFDSYDINGDQIITRDDLEKCLPPTVESHELIQQLLQQWDVNRDGVVSREDFERYIMTNPNLLPMFADPRDRVRMDSVTLPPPTENTPRSTPAINANRNIFITSP